MARVYATEFDLHLDIDELQAIHTYMRKGLWDSVMLLDSPDIQAYSSALSVINAVQKGLTGVDQRHNGLRDDLLEAWKKQHTTNAE